MKKIFVILMMFLTLLGLASCEGDSKKILECDGCGKAVEVDQSGGADPDEDWIIYCEECAEKLEV